MSLELLWDVLKNSLFITGLVVIMMIMIEYVNVASAGKWLERLRASGFRQVVLGALLGMIPGCVGGFAAVSLYTHGVITFGALVAAMIASSGDEAFVMLAMIPKDALLLFGVLFIIALIFGYITNLVYKRGPNLSDCDNHFDIHHGHEAKIPSIFKLSSYRNMLHPSVKRVSVLAGIAFFVAAVFSGILEHEHVHGDEHLHADGHTCECVVHEHVEQVAEHHHGVELSLLDERWMNILFALLSIFVFLLVAASEDHFVNDHIWNHVVKKHCLKIFLWTAGALLVIGVALNHMDLEHWVSGNKYLILVAAALVGMIPESGPNMIFITLFSTGLAPFSVLLTSSISQDGHTSLPLLSSNKRGFLAAKIINAVIALAVGSLFYLLGF